MRHDREVTALAIHEAGHAVVARELRRWVSLVSIDPERGTGLVQCGRHPTLDLYGEGGAEHAFDATLNARS